MAERVDNKLVELGLAQSRERAKALIMEGVVLLDGVRVSKPSDPVREGQTLTIKENPIPFVSRGGLKLKKAVERYDIDLTGLVCVDVGASTGGFTDCMLQNGASKVYAVDT
ncbi:MAG: TlyA family RNA methyltransferase, partial [Clostridia bacterium]|nr:TlyA family RNA methyltransferase [Clostridia bacterium]